MAAGLLDLPFEHLAFAVVDTETTGFVAGRDRIVEISVVRAQLGHPLRVVLNTLVDPGRDMGGTEVHHITASDVVGAPRFREVAGDFLRSICGAVVVGHNVPFDLSFIGGELSALGFDLNVPFVDTLLLRPALGAGNRGTLGKVCEEMDIPHVGVHSASGDARVTAMVLLALLKHGQRAGVHRFRDVRSSRARQFLDSLGRRPLAAAPAWPRLTEPKVRDGIADAGRSPAAQYFDALCLILADLVVSEQEAAHLARLRDDLNLPIEQVRAMHAQMYSAAILCAISSDGWLDDSERAYLRGLSECLRVAGWCPGD